MLIQPIVLAGGSGTRLWPASRQSHPKQLLALTGPHSLLQQTVMRLDGFASAEIAPDIVVVTSEQYRFEVADQLRAVGVHTPCILLEPVGRNTAPALTLAALLPSNYDGQNRAEGVYDAGGGAGAEGGTGAEGDPVMLVMASDHLIKDVPAFHAAVTEGAVLANEGLLVTFGVVPDRAETGYGYIRAGEILPGAKTACLLAGFAEKPDAATAERYLADGSFLWNSGMFMMRRSVWLAAIERYRPDILLACRTAIAGVRRDGFFVRVDQEAFTDCPSDSIDYAVMEKLAPAASGPAPPNSGASAATDHRQPAGDPGRGLAAVVPLAAGWSDIGGWEALWSVSAKDGAGNVVRGQAIVEDTAESLIHADSRLVAVLGGDDLVVVETADAVLVAKKDRTRDLKRLVARVETVDEELTRTHRLVHRPWGTFESITRGEGFQVKHIVVKPGASLSLQLHRQRAEHWVVVRGVAEITCGDKVFRLGENQSTYVPVDTPHRLTNPGDEPLEIIEVQSGDYLGEDDIVRLEDHYGRVETE